MHAEWRQHLEAAERYSVLFGGQAVVAIRAPGDNDERGKHHVHDDHRQPCSPVRRDHRLEPKNTWAKNKCACACECIEQEKTQFKPLILY